MIGTIGLLKIRDRDSWFRFANDTWRFLLSEFISENSSLVWNNDSNNLTSASRTPLLQIRNLFFHSRKFWDGNSVSYGPSRWKNASLKHIKYQLLILKYEFRIFPDFILVFDAITIFYICFWRCEIETVDRKYWWHFFHITKNVWYIVVDRAIFRNSKNWFFGGYQPDSVFFQGRFIGMIINFRQSPNREKYYLIGLKNLTDRFRSVDSWTKVTYFLSAPGLKRGT